jgi:membrane AbrB-like protein
MPRSSLLIEKLPRPARWGVLLVGSFVISAGLELLHLPAALLLGPMIAAILVEVGGGHLRLPRFSFYACQAVIGCMIARVLTTEIIGTFLKSWPLFLALVLSVIFVASFIGWTMSRWRILSGTTAIWGLSPGAASAMVLMAGEFGADTRLVAFMQYLRVVIVATLATFIARFWVGPHGVAPTVIWFPPIHALAFAETLALAIIGGMAGHFLRIPAGVFLTPMVVGMVLHTTGVISIELPPWLLALSYMFLGWNIGLGFTREILAHAFRALPKILAAILILVLFAGALAFILVEEFHVDPLTAYLATSPGGADSVAIIAASSNVNVSFVMAMQTMRFLILVMGGPAISRFVAKQLGPELAPLPSGKNKLPDALVPEDELD